MIQPIRIAAFIAVMVLASIATAAEVIEVRVLAGSATAFPSTRPTDVQAIFAATVAGGGKTIVSIETLVQPDGNYLANSTFGEETVRLKGKLKPNGGGQFDATVEFLCESPGHLLQASTTIDLPVGAQGVIGGTPGNVIVLTIKPCPKP